MSSKTEDMMMFLYSVRRANGDAPIVMILDNCATHHSRSVTELADQLDIHLVYLPPYSPDLNPIELIWKSLKRVVSKLFFPNREALIAELETRFVYEASKSTYLGSWRSIFYPELL